MVKDIKRITGISTDELRKIPFLDITNLNGRIIPALTFYDGEKWHFWFPGPNGLIQLKAKPVEADYFGKSAECETDIYFEFLNFIIQHAYWPKVAVFIDAIQDDIHNLGASLEKFHLFYEVSKHRKTNLKRFVSTEIEYIIGTCRSLFDLLQSVIATLWDTVTLFDLNIKKKHLPKSFRPMIIKDDKFITAEEIKGIFKIPISLAEFYARSAPFFSTLRNYRDKIIHQGKKSEMVFITQKGFAVPKYIEPFASLGVWNEDHLLPNDLASLRPVLAHICLETIKCCEDFAHTVQQIIQFPPEIVPGFRLFLRGYHNKELLRLNEIRDKVLWWDTLQPDEPYFRTEDGSDKD